MCHEYLTFQRGRWLLRKDVCMNTYRGWTITYDAKLPVTGRWRATRYGVRMCAGTEAALKRMIDAKVLDERNRK